MSKNAQDSQSKTDNLCKQSMSEANCDAIADGARYAKSLSGKHVYAYKLSRINPDYANFELWAYCVGHLSEVISIANADEYLKQIERAFFYNEFCITLRGLTVAVPEKLLKQIRKDIEHLLNSSSTEANCDAIADGAQHIKNLVSHRAGSVGNISSEGVSTSTLKTNTDRAVIASARQISVKKRARASLRCKECEVNNETASQFKFATETPHGLWSVCSGGMNISSIPPTRKHLPKLASRTFCKEPMSVSSPAILKNRISTRNGRTSVVVRHSTIVGQSGKQSFRDGAQHIKNSNKGK